MKIGDFLLHVVTMLSREIGVRSYRDTDRLKRTEDFISEQFTSSGYAVSKQPFLFNGNVYNNIVAELTGSGSPGKILVIGAHYDTVRTTPGADDNASGIAGLLALAGALAGTRPSKTVRFAAFALEEWPACRSHNMGSYHYARSLKEARDRVEGMICLEMIGYFTDGPGSQMYPLPLFKLRYPARGNYIAMVGNLRSRTFTRKIAAEFRKAVDLPVVTLNAPAFVIGIDFSDHWSFNRFGYNALMVTDTAFYRNPHYHSSSDTAETLDYERMAKVVEGLRTSIEEWAGVGAP